MKFHFDYLSARLTDRYNWIRFDEECKSQNFDKLSGQVLDIAIRKDQRGMDIHGYQVTARTYNGGQYKFAQIVNRELLKVTRVDIACDLEPGDYPGFKFNANELGSRLKRVLDNFYLKTKRNLISHSWKNPLPSGGIALGHEFGARSSDKQIRIYTKVSPSGAVLRLEFQLRQELARSIWELVKENVYSQDLLAKAFFSLEAKLLEPGIFKLAYSGGLIELTRDSEQEPSNRENWVLTQVLSACIKEFNETGKDLPEKLKKAFDAHFMQIAQENIRYQELSRKAEEANRLFLD